MNVQNHISPAQKAIEDGMVKVGIPADDHQGREWCWGRRISSTHAKLVNCCVFDANVNFGDVVEFSELNDDCGGPHELLKSFVRVVTRGSTQCEFLYATDDEASDKSDAMKARLADRLRKIRATLEAMPASVRPVAVEGLWTGLGCAAFPPTVTAVEAEQMVAACPFVVDQHSEG